MATNSETIEYILQHLYPRGVFTTRAMFGEYALYANGTVVALVCGDTLYVKMLPASSDLGEICEQGHPFSGAKLHYVVDESQLQTLPNLSQILIHIAESIPVKKK